MSKIKVRETFVLDKSNLEEENVIKVYNKIYNHFDQTRWYIWPSVKDFLDKLDIGLNILEVGCGNGRHLLYRPELKIKGTDIIDGFINICKDKGLDVIYGDMRDLCFEGGSVDVLLSIASFHHLTNDDDRRKTIKEFERVLKKGGLLFIQVWEGNDEDVFMKWRCKTGEELDRYYYKMRLETLLDYLVNFEIVVVKREEKNLIVVGKL